MNAPLLVVVCGLSFAGKTTLGSALARRFNYKEVDVDLTKVRLYGVRFEENALDQDAWNRIYDETDREIAQYLQAGASVVDASRNFRKEERSHARRIAALSGADFLLIYIDTPEHVARKRLLANRQRPERVDWVTPASTRSSRPWSRRAKMRSRWSTITKTTSSGGSAGIRLSSHVGFHVWTSADRNRRVESYADTCGRAAATCCTGHHRGPPAKRRSAGNWHPGCVSHS